LLASKIAAAHHVGDASVPLVDLLGHPSRRIVRLACDVLVAAAGGQALDRRLIERLNSGEAVRRWAAAFVLAKRGMSKNERLDLVVIESLASDDRDVRWAAAEAACDLAGRDRCFIDRLRYAARAADVTLRKMALHCLRRSGTGGEGDYAAFLGDGEASVRLAALAGLAVLPVCRKETIVAVIERLVHDGDLGVRCAAAVTLGRIGRGSDRVRLVLAETRETDCDPRLRRVAAESLRRIGEGGRR